MFECTYCSLFFEEKRLLTTHQKTKKCTAHRNIGFVCQQCFKNIKGYNNTLEHVEKCTEKLTEEDMLRALVNQLSLKYAVDVKFDIDNNSGIISFKRICTYVHPSNLNCGVNVPQKKHMFQKTLNKHTDAQLIGSHNLYTNDIFHKIYRLSDPFQFISTKYNFQDASTILWLDCNKMPCFHIKDNTIYVLGKVQCQNDKEQKWFGDTFVLNENEKIIKCVWYKDPELKQFFMNLNPLLKDILNLYLNLGNWALKQKKIKLKPTKQTEKLPCRPRSGRQSPPSERPTESGSQLRAMRGSSQCHDNIISGIIREYNYENLVENIKILSSYDTFYSIFKNLLEKNLKDSILHSNIQHIFKDNLLSSSLVNEEFSLMNMNDPELKDGNYYHLMYYILPESEKNIFLSKH